GSLPCGQKISNELSARVTRIVNDFDTKNNTLEIENIFSKLIAEISTKITNELSARISEINSTFTAELGKNNNKLIAENQKDQFT
ncbi:1155_t:CDS:1, partial [Diversispora eburnea]